MMAVYVETNFVLERSLEQEQSESCGRLVDLATMITNRILPTSLNPMMPLRRNCGPSFAS